MEDCGQPDVELGAGAERADGGCGTTQAIGCAALLSRAGRTVVRVTVNAGMAERREYAPREVYWTVVHEAKHAAGYGHTGQYGGEGGAHPHPSDLGYYCVALGRPCDNPTNFPAREDWEDRPGHNAAWGIALRPAPNAPIPTPTPAPTATPTATPTPMPTPTPAPAAMRVWAHTDDLTGRCPGRIAYGAWCVVSVPAGRVWVEYDDSGEFVELRGPEREGGGR
jgi:hypothetical protein